MKTKTKSKTNKSFLQKYTAAIVFAVVTTWIGTQDPNLSSFFMVFFLLIGFEYGGFK